MTLREGRAALADACTVWQTARDDGSARLLAAARVVTGIPHYYATDAIRRHEAVARGHEPSLARAHALLDAVSSSDARTPQEWRAWTGSQLFAEPYAGRGVVAMGRAVDDQVEEALDRGVLRLPLFGVSLDPSVAETYGDRFLFTVDGPFQGIPAWVHSGLRRNEREVIAGGEFAVVGLHRAELPRTTRVRLRQVGTIGPQRYDDAVPPAWTLW